MGKIDAPSHAFVIRIWLDRAGEEETWRGHITHVETEEQQHFEELTAVAPFMRRYLQPIPEPGGRAGP